MTNRKTVSATDTEVVVKKRRNKVSKEELLAQLKAEQEGQPENRGRGVQAAFGLCYSAVQFLSHLNQCINRRCYRHCHTA